MGFVRLSKTLVAVVDVKVGLGLGLDGNILHGAINTASLLITILSLIIIEGGCVVLELGLDLLVLWPLTALLLTG